MCGIFKMQKNVYHGTITEVPLWEGDVDRCLTMETLNYDNEHAKSSAVYFTNVRKVCVFFSEEKLVDPSTDIPTVIKSNINTQKPYFIDKNPVDFHIHNGERFNWPEERSEFYDKLREEGFDAVIIEAGYLTKGDASSEIAVLDPSIIQDQQVSFKLNGKWTPDMNSNEAKTLLTKIANDPDLIQHNDTPEDQEWGNGRNPLWD